MNALYPGDHPSDMGSIGAVAIVAAVVLLSLPTPTVVGAPPTHLDPSSRSLNDDPSTPPTPVQADARVLILLVAFTDVPAPSTTPTEIADRYLDPTTDSASMAEYFSQSSGDNLTLQGDAPADWVNLTGSEGHYGLFDTSSDPPPGLANGQQLALEAIDAVDAAVDFSLYDEDGDGLLDVLVLLHPGIPDEDDGDGGTSSIGDPQVWSHHATLSGVVRDGVTIPSYLLSSVVAPTARVSRLLCEDLGLVLLRDPDGTSLGVGGWDLLGWGDTLDLPPQLSGPSKWQLGWVRVQIVTTSPTHLELDAVETSRQVAVIPIDSEEFFLLEVRQRTGFDASLPGEGLLVWHVDLGRISNSDDSRRRVDLVEGTWPQLLDSPPGGAIFALDSLWDGSDGFDTLTNTSNPDSRRTDGSDSGVRLDGIASSGSATHFSLDVRLGLPPPVSTLLLSPSAPPEDATAFNKPPIVSFHTDEPSTMTYWVDTGAPQTSPSGGAVSPQPTFVEGDNLLQWFATDLLDNREDSQARHVVLDMTAPTASAEIDPPQPDGDEGWYRSTPQVTLRSEQDAQVRFRLDADAATNYTQPLFAPEGVHDLWYWAVDLAGNIGEPRALHLKVDRTPPNASALVTPVTPDGSQGWYTHPPSVTLSSDDAIDFWWDDEASFPYAGPLIGREGTHTLHYAAVDVAGNIGSSQQLVLRIDSQPPSLALVADPPLPDGSQGWYRSRAHVQPLTDPEATVQCDLDVEVVSPGASLVKAPLVIPEGEHEVRCIATDPAGNRSPPVVLAMAVDTSVPWSGATVQPLPSPDSDGAPQWLSSRVTLTLATEVEDHGSPVTVLIQEDSAAPVRYEGPMALPGGDHRWTYWATDAAGNQQEPQHLQVRSDFVLPQPVLLVPQRVSAGSLVLLDGSDSEDDQGIVTYRFFFDEGQSRVSTAGTISHAFERSGRHTVSLEVVDHAGNTNRTSVEVDVVEPSLAERLDGPVGGGLGATFLLVATLLVAVRWVRAHRRSLPPPPTE